MAGYEYRMKSIFLITPASPEVPGLMPTSPSPDEEYASFGYAQRNQLDAEARMGDDTQRSKSLRDLRSPKGMALVYCPVSRRTDKAPLDQLVARRCFAVDAGDDRLILAFVIPSFLPVSLLHRTQPTSISMVVASYDGT